MSFPPQVLFEAMILPLTLGFVWAVPAMLAGGRGRALIALGAAAGVIVTYVMILGAPSPQPTTSLGRFVFVPIMAVIGAGLAAIAALPAGVVVALTTVLTTAGAAWVVHPQVLIGDTAAILSLVGVAIVAYAAADRMAAMNHAPGAGAAVVIALGLGLLTMTIWGQQTAAAQLALAILSGATAIFWIAMGAPTIGWGATAALATLPAPLTLAVWQVSYGAGVDWAVLPLALIPVVGAALAPKGAIGSLVGRARLAGAALLHLVVLCLLAISALGVLNLPEIFDFL